MDKKSNQDKIYNAFKEGLSKDRSKINILPFSEMGLIQMTRKRVKKSLTSLMCEPCFHCDGAGYQISRRTICYNIYREILRAAQDATGDQAASRRRTIGRGRVEVRKPYSLARQSIEIWCLAVFPAIATQISPAQIVS